eukprot:4591113-Amphidinium_carterae.2
MYDSSTGRMAVTRVPTKGTRMTSDPSKWLARQLEALGHQRLVLRSDEEISIKAVKRGTKTEVIGVDVVFQVHSGESSLRLAKRQKHRSSKQRLDAFLLSQRARRKDSIQAHQSLIRGRRMHRAFIAFGEAVHFKPRKTGGKFAKLDAGWRNGLFLGVSDRGV